MDDAIFLLSKDEYLKYKKFIPQVNVNWWLRSPAYLQYEVAYVGFGGSISYYSVRSTSICVRPALHLDKVKVDESENILVYCGITWVKIDKNIAIAELPISRQSFNKNSNNDYEKSDIRDWLLNWYEKRKNY